MREFLWFFREMEHLGPSEIINHKDSMKRSYTYPKIVAQEVPTKERMGLRAEICLELFRVTSRAAAVEWMKQMSVSH